MLRAALSLSLLAACSPPGVDERPWHVEVALEVPHKLGGCAVGDFDPARPGNEIAAVGVTGEVFLVWREAPGAWRHEVIAATEGELIQCRSGDAYPDRPGDELLVFGMRSGTEEDGGAGAAYLISRAGADWRTELVLEDDALLHAGCLGDLDPQVEGPEILLAGFSRRVFVLHRTDAGWTPTTVATLEGDGKNAVAFAGGAVVAGSDGRLVHVHRDGSGWATRVLDEAGAGQSRLAAYGDRLLVARDDGVLALVTEGGRTEIHREGAKLRGAVLAELDPRHPGPEAASAGYEGKLVVLTGAADAWTAEVLHTEPGRLHHLASGELLAEGLGEELVACGYSGRLLVAWCAPATAGD